MMTCRCSVFCQEPPESSGRWECPDILGSVQVNCFVNNDQLTLATFYNSSKSNQTLQFCFGSYSDHNGGRSCSKSIKMKDVSNSIYLGRIPEDALKVQVIDKMYKFSIIYLFYSFSLFQIKCLLLDEVFLGIRVAKTRQIACVVAAWIKHSVSVFISYQYELYLYIL